MKLLKRLFRILFWWHIEKLKLKAESDKYNYYGGNRYDQ